MRLIIIFLSTTLLFGKSVHEDAEDHQVSRWKLMNTRNTIHNIFDTQKRSRIINFTAKGHKFAYELKMKRQKRGESSLSWEMKTSEDFVIIVSLNTNRGQHYLVYTSGEGKSYMHYGLGRASKNGTWQTITRNLQEDMSYFDNRVRISSVQSFVVRGRGSMDNIITKMPKDLIPTTKNVQKTPSLKSNPFVAPPIRAEITKKTPQRKIFKAPVHPLPIIKLRGAKTVKLQLGEAYIEPGVIAFDVHHEEINVESIENIDVNQDGRYMILYMATDSEGNMALDKRYVEVGEVKKLKDSKVKKEPEEPEEAPEEEEEIDEGTKERNMQIEIWEKRLELKELELARKRKKN